MTGCKTGEKLRIRCPAGKTLLIAGYSIIETPKAHLCTGESTQYLEPSRFQPVRLGKRGGGLVDPAHAAQCRAEIEVSQCMMRSQFYRTPQAVGGLRILFKIGVKRAQHKPGIGIARDLLTQQCQQFNRIRHLPGGYQ